MDLPIALRAMILASEEHLGNKKTPFNHLQNVATMAFEDGGDLPEEGKKILVATCFLHHILDGSDLTRAEISMEFGEEVGRLVGALARRKREKEKNYLRRLEREGKLAATIHRCCKLDLALQ